MLMGIMTLYDYCVWRKESADNQMWSLKLDAFQSFPRSPAEGRMVFILAH